MRFCEQSFICLLTGTNWQFNENSRKTAENIDGKIGYEAIMMTYIAMLRGINVGRGKMVKMERLGARLRLWASVKSGHMCKAATLFFNPNESLN